MRDPSEAQVKAAIEGVVGIRGGVVRVVIAHGSWVRGDFWAGQSDLDLIVIGTGASTPGWIRSKLETLTPALGVRVESWETSECTLDRIRRVRPDGQSIRESGIIQLDLNGFDLVDQHEVVWGNPGRDPLKGFPVPRGQDLQSVAARRVRDLLWEIARYGASEMNRIACDALKAATIFFLLKEGREPTRNKNEMLDRFFDVVPTFGERGTAFAIWDLYRAGDKTADATHGAACRKFIEALAQLVDPPAP